MHRIESRVRRLNALGFDVAELDITTDFAGSTIRIQPKVVDAGHHSRRLLRLTGLDTEENQARRLLNDLDSYRARTDQQDADESIVAHQWLTEGFEPVVGSVPHELRGKLEPAELYHEVLEHRWFLSEQAGQEIADRGRRAELHLDNVLHRLPGRGDRRRPRRSRWSRWPTRSTPRRASSTRTDDKPYDPWEDDDEGPGADEEPASRIPGHRRPAGPDEQADATGLSDRGRGTHRVADPRSYAAPLQPRSG